MECICLQDCTIRMNGKSVYFEKDQIAELEECPQHHFAAIGNVDIDFGTATEELLLRSKKWKIREALEFLKRKYNYEYSGPPLTRKDTAKLVVDMRFRKIDLPKE